jgi:cytochrome c oxidase subunit 2
MDDASVSPPTPPTPPGPPARAATPASTNHIARAAIIWAVCTAIAIVVFLLVAPHVVEWGILPAAASNRSDEINTVMWIFTLLSIPVFFMVVVFGGYAAFAFNRRRGRAGGTFLPSRRLPVVWIIISFVLVTFLYVYGLSFLNQVNAQEGNNPLVVNVTGEQWLWNFSYPQYGNAQSTALELPVNRPVIFHIQSVDVQHSFWIPAFGIKQDAVPGETTTISATPETIGTYVVRCAELCGLYHAYMETPVYVVSAGDFDTWVHAQVTPVPTSSSSSFIQPNVLPAEAANRASWRTSSVAEG